MSRLDKHAKDELRTGRWKINKKHTMRSLPSSCFVPSLDATHLQRSKLSVQSSTARAKKSRSQLEISAREQQVKGKRKKSTRLTPRPSAWRKPSLSHPAPDPPSHTKSTPSDPHYKPLSPPPQSSPHYSSPLHSPESSRR